MEGDKDKHLGVGRQFLARSLWYTYPNFFNKKKVNSVAWGPWEIDLKLAACSSDGCLSILTKTSDGWEAKKIKTSHDGPVNAISWSPACNWEHMKNGTHLAVQKLASVGCDGKLILYTFDHVERTFNESYTEKHAHKTWIRDVSWNPSIIGN